MKVLVMCVRCFAAMPVSVPEEGERIYYMVRPSLRLLLSPALSDLQSQWIAGRKRAAQRHSQFLIRSSHDENRRVCRSERLRHRPDPAAALHW